MKTKIYGICFLMIICVTQSCKKYLDAKADDKFATVATLTEAQLLLDNYLMMNSKYPLNGEAQADNYYLTVSDYNTLITNSKRQTYTWEKMEELSHDDWKGAYQAVFYCNTALAAYDKIMQGKTESLESKNVLGSALFFRAYNFHALAELYAPIYEATTAQTDMGIPVRLDADFTERSTRATMQETYDIILADLKKAVQLLPVASLVKSRPGKPAAYGALARVYLSMRNYEIAGLYADSCLQLSGELLDFNTLSKTSPTPFARFHKEVVFHIRSVAVGSDLIAPSRAKIDPQLYLSYDAKDLRKAIYFRANTGANAGTYNFKGNYDVQASVVTSGLVFGGIATDEMYLIRAESHARAGRTEEAMFDLNTLLKTRWEGPYTSLVANSPAEALSIILTERRKELLYRGTRWTDLRRLSKEPAHAVIPTRTIGTEVYELKPGSLRYVLPIPADVVNKTGMPQNP